MFSRASGINCIEGLDIEGVKRKKHNPSKKKRARMSNRIPYICEACNCETYFNVNTRIIASHKTNNIECFLSGQEIGQARKLVALNNQARDEMARQTERARYNPTARYGEAGPQRPSIDQHYSTDAWQSYRWRRR